MNFGIIAAGEGSRLEQEGVILPKPLVNICGQPMIGRLIEIFEKCGASHISIIVNEKMKDVGEYINDLAAKKEGLISVIVKSTPSSMHSFYELSKILADKGKFIVTTVDTIFREDDFNRYVNAFDEADNSIDGMMAVTSYIDDEKPLYISTNDNGFITGFHDSLQEGVRFVSGGIYGLTPNCFNVLKKQIESGSSRMRNFQRSLIDSGFKLKAFDMGKIIDVDHAADIETARQFLCEVN